MRTFIYKGQTEKALLISLKHQFKYDISGIENEIYTPRNHSVGKIYVGEDVNQGWIIEKKAFYGWDIVHIAGLASYELKKIIG